ncbi:MAG: flippase-like domain-containing protein [Planctomycetes bacterium]|nr:flippase-like domain-containing protein [Planctomycetota bacterium]
MILSRPKSTGALLRAAVFLLLLGFGLYHLGSLYREVAGRELRGGYLLAMQLIAFLCIFVQGSVTSLIASFCGKRLGLLRSFALNAAGGLFSLLVPLGAVGYKALYLDRRLGVPWPRYASFYGISTLASLAAGLLLLALTHGFESGASAWAWPLGLFLLLILLVSLTPPLVRRLPDHPRLRSLRSPFTEAGLSSRLFKLGSLHFIGLLVYMLLYGLGFGALGVQVPPEALALLVVARSLLMGVSLVPGNLVVQELAGAAVGSLGGIAVWSTVIVELAIRLVLLIVLVLAGSLGLWLLPVFSETGWSGPESEKPS